MRRWDLHQKKKKKSKTRKKKQSLNNESSEMILNYLGKKFFHLTTNIDRKKN